MFGLSIAPRRLFPAPPPHPMAFRPPAAPPPPPAYHLTPGQQLKRDDELRRMHAGAVSPWAANLAVRRAAVQQREFQRLLQQNRQLSQQQAALMAQQAALQQVPATPPPVTQMPAQQMPSSPAAPGGDLTPTQDAHEDSAPAAEPEALPHAHNKHLILFVGLAAAAGIGGYMFLKKKKAAGSKS